MEFETLAQKRTYEKILPWIQADFSEKVEFHRELPILGVNVGSAIAWVSVQPWGNEEASILTRAYVVTGIEIDQELALFLLRENNHVRFGAFGLDDAGNIFFDQTIVGSTCDQEELRSSIMAVATTADHYDDQIRGRWGGQRAIDLFPRS